MRRLDVEEDELVGAGVGVRRAELDRVADVAQALEANALDDAAAGDVQAGDQARERHRSRKRAPARPLFSGWNCTPRKLPDSRVGDDALGRRRRRRRLRGERVREVVTPRRPGRRAPSRCGERARRGAARRVPAGGRAPGRRRPPPTTRAPAGGPGRSRASACPRRPARAAPRRARGRARPSIARARRPDAGQHGEVGARHRLRVARRARRRRRARSQARTTERTFPAPYSQTATLTAGPSSTGCRRPRLARPRGARARRP